ncbi:sigma factor G inhibitor Gin [Bacillus badius]|uniref:YaaM protein n=1 Tax=Bacillus badius TaxID=1455 RepID=A0ABR5APF7_BACBA|nr:sigma factor G inhibitor Gin [Bacillus badius]KIL71977.1 yaaM sigma-F protein [Bacillus badius]KIL75733.1 yaaM protein [Bacillus badius]KZO00939.1 sigma factor G inhibitor Gin [Bacillus badius]KZR56727.1 sigma factor G inhibitor Gin [Bacillus badius]MED0667666.1 sigma factor G inhibitor Gin [Bacillus badius]
MKESNKIKTCIVCEKEKKEGLYLYTAFICHECEREMVETEPESPKYAEFVKKLSKIRKPPVFS